MKCCCYLSIGMRAFSSIPVLSEAALNCCCKGNVLYNIEVVFVIFYCQCSIAIYWPFARNV